MWARAADRWAATANRLRTTYWCVVNVKQPPSLSPGGANDAGRGVARDGEAGRAPPQVAAARRTWPTRRARVLLARRVKLTRSTRRGQTGAAFVTVHAGSPASAGRAPRALAPRAQPSSRLSIGRVRSSIFSAWPTGSAATSGRRGCSSPSSASSGASTTPARPARARPHLAGQARAGARPREGSAAWRCCRAWDGVGKEGKGEGGGEEYVGGGEQRPPRDDQVDTLAVEGLAFGAVGRTTAAQYHVVPCKRSVQTRPFKEWSPLGRQAAGVAGCAVDDASENVWPAVNGREGGAWRMRR